MKISADQVWLLSDEGQSEAHNQSGRRVKMVVTQASDVNGNWDAYVADDPDIELFALPENCFKKFVQHVDSNTDDEDDQSDWD